MSIRGQRPDIESMVRRGPGRNGPPRSDRPGDLCGSSSEGGGIDVQGLHPDGLQTKKFNWKMKYSGLTPDQIADYLKEMTVILEGDFTQRRTFQCAGRVSEAFLCILSMCEVSSTLNLDRVQSSIEGLLLTLVRNGANTWCIENTRLYVRHVYVLKTQGFNRFTKYMTRLIKSDEKKSRKK